MEKFCPGDWTVQGLSQYNKSRDVSSVCVWSQICMSSATISEIPVLGAAGFREMAKALRVFSVSGIQMQQLSWEQCPCTSTTPAEMLLISRNGARLVLQSSMKHLVSVFCLAASHACAKQLVSKWWGCCRRQCPGEAPRPRMLSLLLQWDRWVTNHLGMAPG